MLYIYLLYIYVGIIKCVLIQWIIYLQKSYDLLVFTIGIFTRKKSDFNEYSILCCDNEKYYIYSMKYYSFFSPIYVGIIKCVLIQGIIYMQWDKFFECLLGICIRKNQIIMNIVYYAMITKKTTYIPWNVIHLFLLYICRYKQMCYDTRNYLSTIRYDLLIFTGYIY